MSQSAAPYAKRTARERMLQARARELRKQDTWAERLVWSWLRNRRFSGYKFRRQHPYGPYILDFFCLEAALAIELDGSGHGHPGQHALDVTRDAYLAAQGIRMVRIWNRHLRERRTEVREELFRVLMEQAPRPRPAYWGPRLRPP